MKFFNEVVFTLLAALLIVANLFNLTQALKIPIFILCGALTGTLVYRIGGVFHGKQNS